MTSLKLLKLTRQPALSSRIHRTEKAGSVRVFFSKPPADADALIEEKCRSNSGKVILVTSDGELRRRTSEYVIRSIGSGYFLRNYLSTGEDLGES